MSGPINSGRFCFARRVKYVKINLNMVKVLKKENGELYQCEECGFKYTERALAEKCEAWCREHKSCNIEITSHAII